MKCVEDESKSILRFFRPNPYVVTCGISHRPRVSNRRSSDKHFFFFFFFFFFFLVFFALHQSQLYNSKGQFFPLLIGNGTKTTFRRICESLGRCDASAVRMGSRGRLLHGLLADDPRASICNSSVHGA